MTKLSIRFSHTPKIIFASSSKHSGTVVGQRPLHALSPASSRKIYRITQTLLKFSFSSAADDPSYLEISDRLHSLLSLFLFLSGINVSIFFVGLSDTISSFLKLSVHFLCALVVIFMF